MSISKKKSLVGLFFFISLTLFVGSQLFFLKNIFGIDPLKKDILPGGFCKDCNVILISLDALRAKSLPCYGYSQDTAPNLCEFAKKSYLFKNVYSPSSKTLDSHFSIFTSLYPSSHKMTIPFQSELGSDIVTLPEILRTEGYKNIIFTFSNPNLPLDKGFGRGYDYIINDEEITHWIDNFGKLKISKDQKFFAFFHTDFVHDPYIPLKDNITKFYPNGILSYITKDELCKKTYQDLMHEHPERFKSNATIHVNYCQKYEDYFHSQTTLKEYNSTYTVKFDNYWNIFKDLPEDEKKNYVHSLYAARIFELDFELNKFIEYLKKKELMEKTILVITSDHGDEFFEHGGKTHGFNLYKEVIHVPLIIYVPKAKPKIIDKLASSVDIMPTILSLLDIKAPKIISGIDLFSYKENKFVFAEHVTTKTESIITKDWQYILTNKNGKRIKELYNLKDDPEEQSNIESKFVSITDSIEKKLHEYKSSLPKYESPKNLPFPSWIDEEERKKLIETGYF